MGPSENPELTEINTEPPRLRTRHPPGQYITKRIHGTTVTLAVVPEQTDKRSNGGKLARLCLPAKAGATKM